MYIYICVTLQLPALKVLMVSDERALVKCGTQFWPRNGSGELKYTLKFHDSEL